MKKSNHAVTEKENGVKHAILTNMIIVPFIPFLLAIGVSFYFFATTIESNTTTSLKRIVKDHRDMIESFLMERQSDLELITNTYRFEDINTSEAIDTIFHNLESRSNAFVDLGLFDSNGIHLKYSGPYELKGKNYKEESWFKEVMQNGYHISDIFLGYRNIPHFIIAVRQISDGGPWVLRATIDTLFFEKLVSQVQIGNTGESYILNKTGIAQTGRRSGDVRIMDKDPDYSDFPAGRDTIQPFLKMDARKTPYLYSTAGLKNNAWVLVVRQEKKDAYKSLYSALYITLIIMVTGGAVIVVMAFYITERILKRIEQLGQEKKNLGNQLIRATQLAEIGEMAAGFAHEINNPLQIIKSEQALIKILLEDISGNIHTDSNQDMMDVNESLDQIELQVNRCSEITHAILKFGRKNEIKQIVLNPLQIIPEIIHMIEKKAAVNGIRITTNLKDDSPSFMGDPSQFQQVLLNLFNNAIDAVIEQHGSSGGILDIESCKKATHYLAITITDNGSGISPENINKIFSPFFTTKPVGKGTGLGLSVCYGIIESLGGTMEVSSRQNIGTTFVINLPALN